MSSEIDKIRIIDLESGDSSVNITDASHVMMVDSQSTGSKKLSMNVLLDKILAFAKSNTSRILPDATENKYLGTNENNVITWKDLPTQVKPDWNASESSAAGILNKPRMSEYATVEAMNASDANLASSIESEATDRVNAVQEVATSVSQEATARSSADTILQGNIDAEATARNSADTTLQDNIDAEETRATAAEGALDTAIQGVSANVNKLVYAWVFKGKKSPTELSKLTDKRSGDVYEVTVNGTIGNYAVKAGDVVAYFESSWIHVSHAIVAQVQCDWNQTDTEAADYIKNKPENLVQDANYVHTDNNYTNADKTLVAGAAQEASLPAVARTGSYNDLTDKPTIPAAQVNADWTANSGVSQILNKPSLATVATSGSYNDLQNKPTIPAAQVNADWSSNSGVSQILNKPANLVQDANYTHTDNNYTDTDKGLVAGAAQASSLATVATSGSYTDLTNKPTIPAAQVNADWSSNSGVSQILNKPDLKTVATSGNYEDLTNKPSIPEEFNYTSNSSGLFIRNSTTQLSDKREVCVNTSAIAPDMAKELAGEYLEVSNSNQLEVDLQALGEDLAGSGLYASSSGALYPACDGKTIDVVGYTDPLLAVLHPVPDPDGETGKVLTVKNEDNTDKIVWDNINTVPDVSSGNEGDVLTIDNGSVAWVAPSGGGGGGNPYTKVSVTPGDCYLNGQTSDYGYDLYDQDVTISNNTYSVLSSPIGWYPEWYDDPVEQEGWHPKHNLDNLVIKLPDNTSFPMAVVEFTVQDSDDYSLQGCVNNVKVKVGNTELTRMYSAPYNPNALLLSGENNDEFEYWKLATEENHGNPYYRIERVMSANKGTDISAFVHGTKVQVQIFGSCFNVTMSQACGEPSAS